MKRLLLLILIGQLSILTCLAQDQHYKDSLFAELKSSKKDTTKVNLLFEYANSVKPFYKDSVIYYLHTALALSKKTDYKRAIIKISSAISNFHNSNSTTDSAIFYTKMSMAVARELKDSIYIGDAFNNLSYLERMNSGNLEKAMQFLDSAISYANNDNNILIDAYSRKSEIYAQQSKFNEAKYFLQRAMSITPEADKFFLSGQLASILVETGQADSAIRIYNSILERDSRKPFLVPAMKSYLYAVLAYAHMKLNNYKLAIENSETGLKLAIDKHLTKERLDNLNVLFWIYSSKKDYEKALDYYRQSREFSDSLSVYKLKSSEAIFENQLKAERNQQQILLLEKENEKQKLVRNGSIAGIILLLVVAIFIYRNYKKQHALNKQLDETNRTLLETQKQLIASERMAAFGSVAARMAHEIQNPLNFVINFSELSQELIEEVVAAKTETEKIEVAKALTANLHKITHHSKRASEIIKQLQEHSNKGTAHEFFENGNAS